MSELTFDDYKNRISIQEVLRDAGYHFFRRDGTRWPCYYRVDNDGRRVRGDKFIVCANGKACFRPPEQRNYNVISFIAEHPHFFPEGSGGKDPYSVVNEVCHRLLYVPMEERKQRIYEPKKDSKPFAMTDYSCNHWYEDSWNSQVKFFPYFAPRAISRATQRAFSDFFLLATQHNKNGTRQNLSFPMRIPGNDWIVGLEQRGKPDDNGKYSYKGMAKGTNATEGVWLASPWFRKAIHTSLDRVKDVYWFESALDAMAFYQQKVDPLNERLAFLLDNPPEPNTRQSIMHEKRVEEYRQEVKKYVSALYVSTAGSPSLQQLKGVLSQTTTANHHVCFDNDRAGHIFAVDLLLARAGREFHTSILDNDQLQVIDLTEGKGMKYTLNLTPFEFDRIAHVLGVGNPNLQSYVDNLKNPNDYKSGDYDLLPSNTLASSYYSKIESLSEQYSSGELFWGVPPEQYEEVKARYRMIMSELSNGFDETLKSDVEAYKKGKGSIDILTPPNGYKDWNDVIMETKQYDESDTISAMGDDGEVITDEVNQDHEENVKRDDEEETTKRHSRR